MTTTGDSRRRPRRDPAQRLRTRLRAAAGLVGLLAAACAGGSSEPVCRIEVVALEKWELRGDGLDAAYRVRGQAGGPAIVSLVAKRGAQSYVTGPGVEVGPGPFEAIVDLKLTGVPPELLTLLEVGPKRCIASAQKP